jgi:lipopolysaccharide assembly outer membrane protein LptD (OstA)
MKGKKIFLCCLFTLFTSLLYSQEDTDINNEEILITENDNGQESEEAKSEEKDGGKEGEGEAEEKESLSPEKQRIEMEIKTSTLPELAFWCRSLGLSESGTRAELSRRIREYFELPHKELIPAPDKKIITIESAQVTEYFKVDVIDEEYARLTGGVRLSLIDDDTTHKISADEILFNRTRNILTARGNVEYEQNSAGTIESFRGQNITVNLDDWSSIFMDGVSERSLENEETAYRFSGTVISRSSDDVTVLRKAIISNANNEEALWSINSSKLWLLPGSDFAIFNAVLKVGELPLLYIPFFFFPADEMIFHPVIGYRTREGGFIQSTTYILGRPKADEDGTSSLTRIMGNSADTEKERQGLFLRSTGKKIRDPEATSLRALLDHYVNLGTYIGLDLSIPKKGILNPSDFSLGIGITRTVSLTSTGYTPYAPDYDGTIDRNYSNLFSTRVPFRYRMNIEGSINAPVVSPYGGISWSLPYYSDPYADRDFMERKESMDWVNMLQQGFETETDDSKTENLLPYQWHVKGHINKSIPVLSPYISNISISNLSTTMAFKTIKDENIFYNNPDSPGRYFYAPDKYTIYSLSALISGNPFVLGDKTWNTGSTTKTQIDDQFGGAGTPISPWEKKENTLDSILQKPLYDDRLVPPVLSQRFDIPGIGNVKFGIDYELSPTGSSELQFMSGSWKIYQQVDWNEVQSVLSSVSGNGNLNFRLDQTKGLFSNVVTFSGTGTWQDYNYLNEEAFSYQSIIGKWVGTSSISGRVTDFTISSTGGWYFLTENGNGMRGTSSKTNDTAILTVTDRTFDGGKTWITADPLVGTSITVEKKGAYLFVTSGGNALIAVNDRFETDLLRRTREQQYRQTNYSTSYEYKGTVWPFYRDTIFGQSNLQYNLKSTLVRSRRYTYGDGPQLSPQWGSWVKEEIKDNEYIAGLNTHSLSANFVANIMDMYQSISISAALPPLDGLLSTNAIFRFWISETKMDFSMRKPEESSVWKYDPFNFTEILKFSSFSTLTYYMIVEPELHNEITAITTSLSLWNFLMTYKAVKTYKSHFTPDNKENISLGGKWEQYGEKKLYPSELTFAYKRGLTNIEILKNRIGFAWDMNTSVNFDLLQNTNSNFQFQTGLTFGITGFMDIKLSATSENVVIWRYFKNFPGMKNLTAMYPEGPQNNVFTDLLDSFKFWNESKRQRSGFNMKKFDLDLIHYLGDWRADLNISMYPNLNTKFDIPKYEISSEVSFIVQWKPISEIKTHIEYSSENDRWVKK